MSLTGNMSGCLLADYEISQKKSNQRKSSGGRRTDQDNRYHKPGRCNREGIRSEADRGSDRI